MENFWQSELRFCIFSMAFFCLCAMRSPVSATLQDFRANCQALWTSEDPQQVETVLSGQKSWKLWKEAKQAPLTPPRPACTGWPGPILALMVGPGPAWLFSEQCSCASVCHGQISSIIMPSKVSSASFPGWPDKLARHTEGDKMAVTLAGLGPVLAAGRAGGDRAAPLPQKTLNGHCWCWWVDVWESLWPGELSEGAEALLGCGDTQKWHRWPDPRKEAQEVCPENGFSPSSHQEACEGRALRKTPKSCCVPLCWMGRESTLHEVQKIHPQRNDRRQLAAIQGAKQQLNPTLNNRNLLYACPA